MPDQPLVSVVIPTYNRAHLIAEAVGSVLEQDYPSVEILVVDDGSTDDIEAAIARIGDDRIRLFRQPNAGANTARNRGIDEARGDYVALLDSDDRFLPRHLASAVDLLRSGGEKMVVYGRIVVDRGGGKTFLKPPRAMRAGEHMADYLLRDEGFVQTSTVVLPTALAREVRYAEGLPYGQDTDFAIRLYNHGARFVMKDAPSAVFRDMADPNRISTKSRAERRVKWADEMRGTIPVKAYHGFKGWYVAKALRQEGKTFEALSLYAGAVARGCYKPRLSATLFLQIFLPPSLYRGIADRVVGVKGKGKRA